MPSPWTFSESEGQVRIQNLTVPIDFGLEEFCTPAQVAINNQTKIKWVSVIYMQVDGLSSMKISQTYTMCILQRYIVMTHREHFVKLKTSVWMLKNTDIKQCKSVNLDYSIV